MRSQRPQAPRDTFGIAGWLFADLSLALALLFAASVLPGVASQPAGAESPAPTRVPTSQPTPSPSPSPSPTPRPTQCRRTAVLVKHRAIVRASPAGARPTAKRLLAPFEKHPGQQVGLLLTYGHGTTPAAGQALAAEVNGILRRQLPDQVTPTTIVESFFSDVGPLGSVTFDIYLLADSCEVK